MKATMYTRCWINWTELVYQKKLKSPNESAATCHSNAGIALTLWNRYALMLQDTHHQKNLSTTKYNGINIDKCTRTIQKGVYAISIIYSTELYVTVPKEPERIM